MAHLHDLPDGRWEDLPPGKLTRKIKSGGSPFIIIIMILNLLIF